MARHTVDIAILGAGTAGLSARRAAQRAGRSVLLIDPGPFGTTCARVGCMPSKLLIAAADAAHHARHAGPFGVRSEVQVDGRAVMARVQSERGRCSISYGRLSGSRFQYALGFELPGGADGDEPRTVFLPWADARL